MIVETLEEKKARIFNFYKKDLEKLGGMHGQIRFNVIEYVCYFPKINPFEMANALIKDAYNVVFDDSSISAAENERKRRKAEKFA